MIEALQNVNLYQPKKITIETSPYKTFDEGVPYDATRLTITQEQENGEQKVWADYVLTQGAQREFESLTETLKSIYAQETYTQQTTPTEDKNYTPPIGKDGW